ncbi:hypothetical protein GCM10027449_09420 [Sinomonas notoginsengisoli]
MAVSSLADDRTIPTLRAAGAAVSEAPGRGADIFSLGRLCAFEQSRTGGASRVFFNPWKDRRL